MDAGTISRARVDIARHLQYLVIPLCVNKELRDPLSFATLAKITDPILRQFVDIFTTERANGVLQTPHEILHTFEVDTKEDLDDRLCRLFLHVKRRPFIVTQPRYITQQWSDWYDNVLTKLLFWIRAVIDLLEVLHPTMLRDDLLHMNLKEIPAHMTFFGDSYFITDAFKIILSAMAATVLGYVMLKGPDYVMKDVTICLFGRPFYFTSDEINGFLTKLRSPPSYCIFAQDRVYTRRVIEGGIIYARCYDKVCLNACFDAILHNWHDLKELVRIPVLTIIDDVRRRNHAGQNLYVGFVSYGFAKLIEDGLLSHPIVEGSPREDSFVPVSELADPPYNPSQESGTGGDDDDDEEALSLVSESSDCLRVVDNDNADGVRETPEATTDEAPIVTPRPGPLDALLDMTKQHTEAFNELKQMVTDQGSALSQYWTKNKESLAASSVQMETVQGKILSEQDRVRAELLVYAKETRQEMLERIKASETSFKSIVESALATLRESIPHLLTKTLEPVLAKRTTSTLTAETQTEDINMEIIPTIEEPDDNVDAPKTAEMSIQEFVHVQLPAPSPDPSVSGSLDLAEHTETSGVIVEELALPSPVRSVRPTRPKPIQRKRKSEAEMFIETLEGAQKRARTTAVRSREKEIAQRRKQETKGIYCDCQQPEGNKKSHPCVVDFFRRGHDSMRQVPFVVPLSMSRVG